MYIRTKNTLYPPDTQNHGEAINPFSTEGLNADIMNDDAKHMYVNQFQYTEDVNAFQNCSLTNALLHVLMRACVCVCVYTHASVYVFVGYMFI